MDQSLLILVSRGTALRLCLLALVTSSAASCVQYREIVSFDEGSISAAPEVITNDFPLEIRPDDLLRIQVHSFDPLAAAPFNLEPPGTGGGMMMQGGLQQLATLELFQGYLVDDDGNIDFPVLGPIEVTGLTLEQLKERLRQRLTEYLKEPVVNVRLLNLKVTVLGEVNIPGVIRLTNPRVTVLEAIGLAGDLTNYSDRSRLLVVREREGERVFAELDLRDPSVFASPFFYLEQNDLVYVRPIEARVATVADPGQRVLQYTSAILSAIAIVVAIVLR